MKYELVHTDWSGGRLHGLLSHPESRPSVGLAVHVHGTWGNFYGNDVVAEMGRAYNAHGYSFLAANFSGHDETAIHESFDDFPESLNSWLETTFTGGRLILQGHSLGALKILYLAATNRLGSTPLHGVLLLSVFDSVGFYRRESAPDAPLEQYLSELRDAEGDRAIVPESVFPHWQISAATLSSAVTAGGDWDQFPTRDGGIGLVGQLGVPTAVLLGSADFASVPGPERVHSLVQSANGVTSSLIAGAPHNFAGKEQEAGEFVSRWLAEIG